MATKSLDLLHIQGGLGRGKNLLPLSTPFYPVEGAWLKTGKHFHKDENLLLIEFECLDISIFYFLQIAILFEYKVSSEPIDLNHLRAKIRLSRSLYLNPRSPVTLLSSLHTQTEIFFKLRYFSIKYQPGNVIFRKASLLRMLLLLFLN